MRSLVQHSTSTDSTQRLSHHSTDSPHTAQWLPQGANSGINDSEHMDPSLCNCTRSLARCHQKRLGNICGGMCAAQLSILPCNPSVSSNPTNERIQTTESKCRMDSAWTSKNANDVGNRSVSAAVYNSKYIWFLIRIKRAKFRQLISFRCLFKLGTSLRTLSTGPTTHLCIDEGIVTWLSSMPLSYSSFCLRRPTTSSEISARTRNGIPWRKKHVASLYTAKNYITLCWTNADY